MLGSGGLAAYTADGVRRAPLGLPLKEGYTEGGPCDLVGLAYFSDSG